VKVWHPPTGKLIRGHVLDVSRVGFNRALRDLDSQLYTVWNPTKLKGWGCWEIRRRPNRKTAVYRGAHAGVSFYELAYVEYRDVHHVLDCAFLNYDAIRKLKEMDTFNKNHWIHNMEYLEQKRTDELYEKALEERKYAIKQHKSAIRDLYEMVRSGIHPGQIVTSTKWEA
jgi:hypothetical protein